MLRVMDVDALWALCCFSCVTFVLILVLVWLSYVTCWEAFFACVFSFYYNHKLFFNLHKLLMYWDIYVILLVFVILS